jgi:hypothetical protein
MRGLIVHGPAVAPQTAARRSVSFSEPAFWFMTAVVVIQGGHVVEHVVQLLQVYALGVAEEDALGLLGYVLAFNGTEEWLHLGYNSFYLIALYALILPLWRVRGTVLPLWAFWFFVAASVWVETWHMVEHGVIISNVIANGGCPCPGIGDVALNLSDTILHFVYNAVAYAGIVCAYVFVLRQRGGIHRRAPRRP